MTALTPQNMEKYKGKYVAIIDEKIVASDKDMEKVVKKVRGKFPKKEFALAHIPPKGVLAYVLFLPANTKKG